MYEDNQYYDNEYQRPPKNPMATAAFTLGIISILSCTFIYIALPCGALAILCGILSRSHPPMPGKSRTGIVFGLIGMAATLSVTLFSLHNVLTNPQLRSYVEQYLQLYTGDSSLTLDQLFPFIQVPEEATAETESENETDNRVRLRMAPDEPETSPNALPDETSRTKPSPETEPITEAVPLPDDTVPLFDFPEEGGVFL